jgi:hypothetical protein
MRGNPPGRPGVEGADMAESKFIQITAAQVSEAFARVYALDDAGRVWEYDFNHRRWHALEEGREPMFAR